MFKDRRADDLNTQVKLPLISLKKDMVYFLLKHTISLPKIGGGEWGRGVGGGGRGRGGFRGLRAMFSLSFRLCYSIL